MIAVCCYAKSLNASRRILLILLSVVNLGVLCTELLPDMVLGLTKTQIDLLKTSEAGCKMFDFFRRFFTQLSSWTVVLLTTVGLISVAFPSRAPQLRQIKFAVMTWLIATLFAFFVNFYAITGMVYRDAEGLDGSVLCQSHPDHMEDYTIYASICLCVGSLIPGVMDLAMNIAIMCIRQSGHGEILMFVQSAVGFLLQVLMLPATVYSILGLNPAIPLDYTNIVGTLFALLNNASMFLFYSFTNQEFRQTAMRMFGCDQCGQQQQGQVQASDEMESCV